MDDQSVLTTLKLLIIGESGVGKSRYSFLAVKKMCTTPVHCHGTGTALALALAQIQQSRARARGREEAGIVIRTFFFGFVLSALPPRPRDGR